MPSYNIAADAAHSPSLDSLPAEESPKRVDLSAGCQWDFLKDNTASKKAKRKATYVAGDAGRRHPLNHMKTAAAGQALNKTRKPEELSKTSYHQRSVLKPPEMTAATLLINSPASPQPSIADDWPVDRICSLCDYRFNTTTQLERHLADPTLHLEHPDRGVSKAAEIATMTTSSNATKLHQVTPQISNSTTLPPVLQELRQDRRTPYRVPKKRSWEDYSGAEVVPICSSNESIPAAKSFSQPEKDILEALLEDRLHPPENASQKSHDTDTTTSGPTVDAPLLDLPTKPLTDVELCPEQRRLVHLILSGKNVFYSGSAGCGKSTVLKNFVARLKSQQVWKGGERKEPKQVDIIAPTGRAALDINGSTSWTYAGWNPDSMKKPLEKLKDAAERGKWVRKRLRATDVLVIDEISMMENHHLERLNEIMQSARGNARAFGGVQLVVTGDFCQLPPVKPFAHCYKCGKALSKTKADTISTCPEGHGEWHDSEKWAFCSSAWEAADFVHVNLTTIHRQSDRVFIDILQKCRLGVPFTPQEENLLLQHESQTGNAVKLFSTRQEVGAINREAFNRLPSSQRTFNCYDDFRCYNSMLESKGRRSDYDGSLEALREHRFDARIDLKQGMIVVLLVNLDQENGLVNGSQGVIMGFEKAEDNTMPEAIKKDDKDFSRISSGPMLTGEHAEVREANIRAFMDNAKEKVWPKVLFQNRVTRTIYADCRVTELGDEAPYSLISRTQIPLVAGWSMTVHKSQGMTLNRVVVNLTKSFEEGQMYVALSRARSLDGLKVEGLGKQQGCNERVRQFLREKLGIEGAWS